MQPFGGAGNGGKTVRLSYFEPFLSSQTAGRGACMKSRVGACHTSVGIFPVAFLLSDGQRLLCVKTLRLLPLR